MKKAWIVMGAVGVIMIHHPALSQEMDALFQPGIVAQTPDVDCSSAQTQLEINTCLSEAAAASDRQMNQIYQTLSTNSTPTERRLLRTAQRAWTQFRDRNCAYAAAQYEGGSIAPSIYSSCLDRVTQQRITELEGYSQPLEEGTVF